MYLSPSYSTGGVQEVECLSIDLHLTFGMPQESGLSPAYASTAEDKADVTQGETKHPSTST